MSQIAYDPVKDSLAAMIRKNRPLRSLFYGLLDLFFLRSWFVRRALRNWYSEHYGDVRVARKGLRILDAGSGFGQYDQFMLRTFSRIRIDAIDVKQDYLDDCDHYFKKDIKRNRIRFRKMDLLEPTFEKRYDLVLCIDVMEHIEEDRSVLKHISDAMKPDATFIMHSPSHYAEDDAGGDDSFVGEHARAGYSKDDIAAKLREAGLEPKELRYTYGVAGHTAWVMLIKWPMLWINKIGKTALLLMLPWYVFTLIPGLLLMSLDMIGDHKKGTGILVVAKKQQ
jgi:SAM-dependent methyltransferase